MVTGRNKVNRWKGPTLHTIHCNRNRQSTFVMSQRASASSSWQETTPPVRWDRPVVVSFQTWICQQAANTRLTTRFWGKFYPLCFIVSCSAGIELRPGMIWDPQGWTRPSIWRPTQPSPKTEPRRGRCHERSNRAFRAARPPVTTVIKQVIIRRLSGSTSHTAPRQSTSGNPGFVNGAQSQYAVTGPEIKHNK